MSEVKKKTNGKQKGKSGELELAKILREYGFQDARRTVQYNGKAEEGEADLKGLEGYHIECKRVEKLNLSLAMEQAVRDAQSKGDVPLVVHRKNREPWYVTLKLSDFIELYKKAYCQEENEPMKVCEHCLQGIMSREGAIPYLTEYNNDDENNPIICDWCDNEILQDVYYKI